MELGGLGSENLGLGGGVRKVGIRGWNRGCGLGEFRVRRVGIGGLALRGLESGDWGQES